MIHQYDRHVNHIDSVDNDDDNDGSWRDILLGEAEAL